MNNADKFILDFPKKYINLIQKLQQIYAHDLKPVLGAGKTQKPKFVLLFMNPTDKNISTHANWHTPAMPWIGTKQVWKFLYNLKLLSDKIFHKTQTLKPQQWSYDFVKQLYTNIAYHRVYIAEFVKITTHGAINLPDSIYKQHFNILKWELKKLKPQFIFALGAQVARNLIKQNIKIGQIHGEMFSIKWLPSTNIIPTYYPLGQGLRNQNKAIKVIKPLLN